MKAIDLVSNNFEKWVGYYEKKSLNYVGMNMDNPEDFVSMNGDKNYTIFAKDFGKWTSIEVQGMAWCDTFIDSVFIHTFGKMVATSLLGGFSAWTPQSAQFFKDMHRFHNDIPQYGNIIFYRNSERINHTGFVISCENNTLITIEGNVSGAVRKKVFNYSAIKSTIAGCGCPNYSVIKNGWLAVQDGYYRYIKKDMTFATDCEMHIDGLSYCFDKQAYMLTGQYFINGKRRYFSTKECIEGAELVIYDDTESEVEVK